MMNIAIWIAIALVCFVLPSVELTQGGNRAPYRKKLAKHAHEVGLPLPDHVVTAVSDRIRRRERGMLLGGLSGVVVATIMYILFFDDNDGAAPALVFFMAGAGSALGGAWAMLSYRPEAQATTPTVARLRTVTLADYLTKGERFGFRAVPQSIVVGAIGGYFLLDFLPDAAGANRIVVGMLLSGVGFIVWAMAALAARKMLAAPARSGSDVELAWDDAERAVGLRQVANLAVAVACMTQLFWLIFLAETLLTDGFYREYELIAWIAGGIGLVYFGLVTVIVAAGPMTAWLTGHRKGYEQRKLWPFGVSA